MLKKHWQKFEIFFFLAEGEGDVGWIEGLSIFIAVFAIFNY